MTKYFISLLLFFTAPIYAASASEPFMGRIDFPISIEKTAHPAFIKGVLFLHNFDYEKAREQFKEAIRLDQNAVMPYWGMAMTYNHPLWEEVDIENGRAVIKQLGNLKAHNEKEIQFVSAIRALYGEGEKEVRDYNYLRIMHDLAERYPNDNEVAIFYALALLGSAEGQRDFTTYMRAGSIAEDIARKNPDHPGAIHYAIHSFDDPIHAPLGLYYANKYSIIAPDAAHALHMPSHIYLALGMWDKVVVSNKKAWEARINNNEDDNPQHYTVHDVHALQWLSYGYLQLGENQQALNTVKLMEQIVTKNSSPMMKWYYALMRAAYLSETQDFQANLKNFEMKGVELNGFAANVYANSLINLNNSQDKTRLESVIAELETLCKAIPNKKFSHCGVSDYFTSITEGGIMIGKIVTLELKAMLALKNKNSKTAIRFLREALEIEDNMPFGYGPPSPVKPASELLADVYFDLKMYTEACQMYTKTLKKAPNRKLARIGYEKTIAMMKKLNIKIVQAYQPIPYFNSLMK